jgi:hypothetical protein
VNVSISSWPAAVVIVALVLLAAVFLVVLGLYSPVTLTTIGGAVAALLVGQMRPALAVGAPAPKPPTGSP